jgi:integrase
MRRARGLRDRDVPRVRGHLAPHWQRVFDLALYTGWRIGDCVCLRTDAMGSDGTVTIYAQKSGRLHIATLPPDLHTSLLRHAGQWWVFPSPYKGGVKPVTRQAAHKAIQRACERAGVASYSPHSVRKLFARRLLAQGVSIREIQSALGHAKPETTLVYLLDLD